MGFNRVLLKLSGEALMGRREYGLDAATIDEFAQELVDAEREILSRSEEVLGKPENVREKIVEGQLNKRFYGESVLTEQTWYRADESTASTGKYLAERGVELLDYAWYAVSAN